MQSVSIFLIDANKLFLLHFMYQSLLNVVCIVDWYSTSVAFVFEHIADVDVSS